MHSLMFVASIPRQITDWNEFAASVSKKLQRDQHIARLSENAWLLDLTQGTSGLGHLIVAAETRGISYGLLPFEHKPQWLPDGFDPKTIQGQSGQS
jgi:hypothetical protein